MSRCQCTIYQNPGPRQTDMCTQSIVDVASDFIITIGSHFSKRARIRCSSKTTDGHRKTIDDREIGIMWNVLSHHLPQLLFHLPQIGCLAGERSTRDLAQAWKPV